MNMITKMKFILSSSFLKSIITLASGSIVAQLISILASPITTRIFSPEELGIYTLVMTAVSMFGPIINLRYDLSIVMEDNEDNVYSLIKLSLHTALVFSTVVSFFYYFYFVFQNQVNPLLCTIVVWILLIVNGIINVLNCYNNRLKEFKAITSAYVKRTFAQTVAMIISGLLCFGYYGLLASQVVGQFMGMSSQSKSLLLHYSEIKGRSKLEEKAVMGIHKKQLITVPATFLNAFSYSSINIIIDMLYGSTLLGFYSISYRMLGLPLSIISNNVSRVFFVDAAKEFSENKAYTKSLNKTLAILFIIAGIMFVVLELFSPQLFEFFFGEEWRVSGVYVQILAPLFSIRLIASAIGSAIYIVGNQKFDLVLQTLLASTSVFCYLISIYFNFSIYEFLITFTFAGSLIYLIQIILVYKLSKGERYN